MPVSGSATPTVDNSRPTISEPKLALQAAISNSKISVAPEGNSPQSHSQPAHQNDPATPVSALAGNLDKSGEGGFNQSRENSSTFQQDPKRSFAAPSPASLHQADAVMPTFAAVDSNAVISNGSPANNAQNPLSKSAILPIDQQAEKSQPSMKTDLNVRIQGQSGENINLRISERAGDIQISVRSSDQTTAAALRHELPSIQAGLERAGWHMENGGMAQSGQDNHEPGRGSQNPDKNRDQNHQACDWQDRNQRRKDSSANAWFELDQ